MLALFLCAVISGGLFWAFRFQELSRQLKQQDQLETEKLRVSSVLEEGVAQKKAAIVTMQKKLSMLKDETEAFTEQLRSVRVDRDNLQAQRLRYQDREDELKRLGIQISETEKELGAIEASRKEISAQEEANQKKLEQLKEEQSLTRQLYDQLSAEKQQLLSTLKALREESGLQEIGDANQELQEKIRRYTALLEKTEERLTQEARRESELKNEVEKSSRISAQLHADYLQGLNKNKLYEQKLVSDPTRLNELTRRYRQLIAESVNTHYTMGVFYEENKEYVQAVREFERALELDPQNPDVYFNLGRIHAENLNDKPQAVEYFKKYLRYVQQDDENAQWVRNYIYLLEKTGGGAK